MSELTFDKIPEPRRRMVQLDAEVEKLLQEVSEHETVLMDRELESQAINKSGVFTYREQTEALGKIKAAKRMISMAQNRIRRIKQEYSLVASSAPSPLEREASTKKVTVAKPNASPFVGAQPPAYQGHTRTFSDVIVRARGQRPTHPDDLREMRRAVLAQAAKLPEEVSTDVPKEVSPILARRGMVRLSMRHPVVHALHGTQFLGGTISGVLFPKAKSTVNLQTVQKAVVEVGSRTVLVSGSTLRALYQQTPEFSPGSLIRNQPHVRNNPETMMPMPSGKVRRKWKGHLRYHELRQMSSLEPRSLILVPPDSSPIRTSVKRAESLKLKQEAAQSKRRLRRIAPIAPEVRPNPERRVLVRDASDNLVLHYQPVPGAPLLTDKRGNPLREVVEPHEIIRAHNLAAAYVKMEQDAEGSIRITDDPQLRRQVKREVNARIKEIAVRASKGRRAYRRAKARR